MSTVPTPRRLATTTLLLVALLSLVLFGRSTSNAQARPTTNATQSNLVFMPLVLANWPPVPAVSTVLAIDNTDQDNAYTVIWSFADRATGYVLEEATRADFANAQVVYQGPGNTWNAEDKMPATYHYRVKAYNGFGASPYSAVQSVRIYPLFVGNEIRWDSNGYIRGTDHANVGHHVTWHVDQLTNDDTVRVTVEAYYDPNPYNWPPETIHSFRNILTGEWLSSSVPDDPDWKWGYPRFLTNDFEFSAGTWTFDDQPFTVTGPYQGYTAFGQPVTYWEAVNQSKFLMWDGGGDWQQYVHPGEAILRYDVGASNLLIYSNVLRRSYYKGDLHGNTVQYIANLSAATSFPGSPPITNTPLAFDQNGVNTRAQSKPLESMLRSWMLSAGR